MDDLKVRLTMAATMATEPTRTGRRKCTASTDAVTHGLPAMLLAASPAQMSIQLSTCVQGLGFRTSMRARERS